MWRPTLLLVCLALPAAAQDIPPPRPIELYCTDSNGDRIELGEIICISTSCVPRYLARCEMSLNNVMWRKLQDGCPGVSLQGGEPPGDPGTVHPEVRASEPRPS